MAETRTLLSSQFNGGPGRSALRTAFAFASLVLIACASGTGGAPGPKRTKDLTHTSTAGGSDKCRAVLKALAEGRLAEWVGVAGCVDADAEAALGPSVAGPALADAWGRARHHPGGAATPHGVDVWLDGSQIVALLVIAPRVDPPLIVGLGEPEGRIASGLSSDWKQWAYPSRGLAAHIARPRDEVRALYGFSPMPMSEFLRSELALVRNIEDPVQ